MAIVFLNITENDRILIIAPHPDDECIGCGGLLSLYPEKCDVVVMTDGSRGDINNASLIEADIRKKQFIDEMNIAGIKKYMWQGYPDGELINARDCADSIDFEEYTKVFLPSRDDNHPDHTAAFFYCYKRITEVYNNIEIFEYEVHVPLRDFTHFLDITEVIGNKKTLINCHKDQVEQVCYDEISCCLNNYRALKLNKKGKYFEVYHKVDEIDEGTVSLVEREKILQKFIMFYNVLIQWIKVYQNGKNIVQWLENKRIETASVYGYAEIGKLVSYELSVSKVRLLEILDKNEKKSEIIDCNVINPIDGNKSTGIVIVTAVSCFDEIKKDLKMYGYNNIVSIETILQELLN
ncbi:MAG: PIG-L deacetylase family protein [Lachnospira sp.]